MILVASNNVLETEAVRLQFYEKQKRVHLLLLNGIRRIKSDQAIPLFFKDWKEDITITRELSEAENNFFDFFETLGQDLSQLPHLALQRDQANTLFLTEFVKPGHCHTNIHKFLYETFPNPGRGPFKLWMGIVDCYKHGNYRGTYFHSFFTLQNEDIALFDPNVALCALTNTDESHYNHFGVYIPTNMLSYIEANIPPLGGGIKYNYCGFINEVIFNSQKTTTALIQALSTFKDAIYE